MRKVYIVGGGGDYKSMFEGEGWEVVDCFSKADLIQFTGGADVSPALYGESTHPQTELYNHPHRHNWPNELRLVHSIFPGT